MKSVTRWMGVLLAICSFVLLPLGASAEDVLHSAARTREGIVDVIDYTERTAIISGYKYSFGEPGSNYYPEIKMLGSNFGSFELLQPGMKVRVVYGEFGFIRVVVSLVQLPYNFKIKEI